MKSTKLMHIGLSDLHWFPKRNVGRHASNCADESTKKTLAVSLAGGWLMGMPLEASPILEGDIAEAMQEREATWAMLKTAVDEVSITDDGKKVNLTPAEVLRAWESEYVVKGKLRKPSYVATFAYQRSSVIPLMLAFRTKIAVASGKPTPESYTIPTIVETYGDPLEATLACLRENTSKTIGATAVMMHWASLFVGAKAVKEGMVAKGEIFTEAALMRKLGWAQSLRGRVQKMFYLLQLYTYVQKYIIENPSDEDSAPDIEELIAENNATVASWRFEDMSSVKKRMDTNEISINEVAELLTGEVVKAKKLPSRTQLEERYKQSTNKLEQLILQAVLQNNLGILHSMPVEFNKQINGLFNMLSPLNVDLTFKQKAEENA